MEVLRESRGVKLRKKQDDKSPQKGVRISRRFVAEGEDPYDSVKWVRRRSVIRGGDGKEVFSMDGAEVPESWSQLATDILVSKYFRRSGVGSLGYENSARQSIGRIARTITNSGLRQKNYFATEADAKSFESELTYILLNQYGAFNSPVWFNCGLHHEYGIQGSGGNFYLDPDSQSIKETKNSYEHPQCSACFIQSVDDNLMDIFGLVQKEARIFKYGSGTGTNFSKLRGHQERLSGGGHSSGLMSFLEVLDRSAGATKSGGTTRRAAKMVTLDMDHPEIKDFINWKVKEEKKVKALVDAGYSSDFNGDAYRTVAGQNSNNSVRISDEFMKAVEEDQKWSTTARTTGEVIDTYLARDLWKNIAEAAWVCADPGLQFDTTIQKWHTCPQSGRINASNPCSEFMFLDNTACNLASVNLLKFIDEDGQLKIDDLRHTSRILLLAQEILVDLSSYPTQEIAQNSHDYRPLGLGYANLGTLLMVQGLPYDSDKARDYAALITALIHGQAYLTSSEIAKHKGAFNGYEKNKKDMLNVMEMHKQALKDLNKQHLREGEYQAAEGLWSEVLASGQSYGYRNAQVTVLAPTGTIGLLMDCDTTGVEPDFALVKLKKLVDGGYIKIINQSVPRALQRLGYSQSEIQELLCYVLGSQNLDGDSPINRESLSAKGFLESEIKNIESQFRSAMDLSSCFHSWVLGEEFFKRMELDQSKYQNGRDLLIDLGFSDEEIQISSDRICGHQTLEGAKTLRSEHLAVFDCANRCGPYGTRFIEPMGHIRMMAAVQPFLSGAISKTVNLPTAITAKEIEDIHYQAWQLGLKAVAIYRDGCKMSQPLNTTKKAEKTEETSHKENIELRGQRRNLPYKRDGFTVEARVAGHQVYLRTGEYANGQLGEIFIDMHKEGATLRSLLNCFAISVSLGLQYGVPLEEYVKKFTFTRFEPHGFVDHPNIKSATSILDYIFRVLGMEYLGQTDVVHIKPDESQLALNRNREIMPSESSKPHIANSEPKIFDAPISQQLSGLMADAPLCNDCGHTTVRNGSCYRCLNCGNSLGCS